MRDATNPHQQLLELLVTGFEESVAVRLAAALDAGARVLLLHEEPLSLAALSITRRLDSAAVANRGASARWG